MNLTQFSQWKEKPHHSPSFSSHSPLASFVWFCCFGWGGGCYSCLLLGVLVFYLGATPDNVSHCQGTTRCHSDAQSGIFPRATEYGTAPNLASPSQKGGKGLSSLWLSRKPLPSHVLLPNSLPTYCARHLTVCDLGQLGNLVSELPRSLFPERLFILLLTELMAYSFQQQGAWPFWEGRKGIWELREYPRVELRCGSREGWEILSAQTQWALSAHETLDFKLYEKWIVRVWSLRTRQERAHNWSKPEQNFNTITNSFKLTSQDYL